MIHPVDGGFVISSGGRWLPGLYATRAAAQWAFHFSDDTLVELRDLGNQEGRAITSEDLRARYQDGSGPQMQREPRTRIPASDSGPQLQHGTRPMSGRGPIPRPYRSHPETQPKEEPVADALRDQIAAVLGQRLPCLKCSRTVACRCYVKDAPPYHQRQADALMIVVQPVLDKRDAETRRLRTLVDEAERSLPIEQRRLLAISRMVFDQIAEGRPFTRDEAADLAQRIVDEIGHSVTDEPALGPSFRVEIDQLKATIERVRAIVPEIDGTIRSMEAHQLPLAADLRYDLDRLKAALDQPAETTDEDSCAAADQPEET